MRVLLAAFVLAFLAAAFVPGRADATTPSVSLTSPAAGVVKGTVTLNAAITGSAAEVRYYSDGVEIGADLSCCTWDELWDTTTAAEGDRTLVAKAKNSAGEVGASAPVVVTVDNVATPPPPSSVPNGCKEGWYPVDGQSWWWEPSFGGDKEFNSRHLHVGGCIPRRSTTLSGTVPFDVVVKMHNNPGKVYYVAVAQFSSDGTERTTSVNPGWTCPTRDCTFVRRFDIPMSNFTRSGLQEIRFRASDRQSDMGTEIRASVNFQAHIANGKSWGTYSRNPYVRGKGWYSGMNYCEASYRDDLRQWPYSPLRAWSPCPSARSTTALRTPTRRATTRASTRTSTAVTAVRS